MQDAIDPDIGQQEIVAMKKEIHIMELRYEQLRRRQEEMIKNIERAVENRQTIQLKYLPKVEKRNAGKGKAGVTGSLAEQNGLADRRTPEDPQTHDGEQDAAGELDPAETEGARPDEWKDRRDD